MPTATAASHLAAAITAAAERAAGSAPFQDLFAGRLPADAGREFVRNVVRTHYVSPHVLAFVYALTPGAAAPLVLANLGDELGVSGEAAAHPDLLRRLAAGGGCGPAEVEALIVDAEDRLRALCARPLPFRSMREVGLSVLLEMLAFEHFLSRQAGRIAAALATHHGLSADSLQWFDIHAAMDVRHAAEGLEVLAGYLDCHGLDDDTAALVLAATFEPDPILRGYFPGHTPYDVAVGLTTSRPAITPVAAHAADGPTAPAGVSPAAPFRVVALDIFELRIPFVRAFAHARFTRAASDAVVVRVREADGYVGYGEGLPREYVTGEDVPSMVAAIRAHLAPRLFAARFPMGAALFAYLRGHVADWTTPAESRGATGRAPAACCAVELAVLDLALRREGRSLAHYLPPGPDPVRYDGVISSDDPATAAALARRYVAFGIDRLKVKVGTADDDARLAAIRNAVGAGPTLRVDANGVWSADEAVRALAALTRFDLAAVEQPVPAADLAGLRRVREATGLPVVADESLISPADAERLVAERACDVFNLRLSKCGGLSAALAIADVARAGGIALQVGAQVGETAILSAAGRHLAAHLQPLVAVEGSFGTFLLAEDVAAEAVAFGPGGLAPPLAGSGLGVSVREAVLERFTLARTHLDGGA